MRLVNELSEIGRTFVDPETGVIDYHAGEALLDAYFEALHGKSSSARTLFKKHLRTALNDRLRPGPKKQGEN